ncbi:MAG: helix-turn-helix transcriptional regulator, partial [Promethearchaeota archaeon]
DNILKRGSKLKIGLFVCDCGKNISGVIDNEFLIKHFEKIRDLHVFRDQYLCSESGLNKIIEERGYRNWVDIKFSSIYKSLSELEKKGLILGKKSQKSLQPSKKVYTLTQKGAKTFEENILSYLSDPPVPKSLFSLALSSVWFLSKDQVLTALSSYKENLKKRISFLQSNLDVLENIERFRNNDPSRFIGLIRVSDFKDDHNIPIILALFELPLKKIIAEKQWLETFIEKIKQNDNFPVKKGGSN